MFSSTSLSELLNTSAQLHRHLCPRQVLGVRMGLLAGQALDLPVPQPPGSKRLLTIIETDGCAADGVAVATHCQVGRRTLRVEDYGKVAATFVDSWTRQAVRLVPHSEARQRAQAWVPEARTPWEAMLLGYQRLPAEMLFTLQSVQLQMPVEKIISRAGKKARCQICDEEIINEREVLRGGCILCRSCAGPSYYQTL